MDTVNGEDAMSAVASCVGLDAYSQDGQFIGRVTGFVRSAPESELAIERGSYDAIDAQGHIEGARHVVINGTGTIIQSMIIATIDTLEIDLRGRRVTIPLTITQIEAMPHHDPNIAADVPAM